MHVYMYSSIRQTREHCYDVAIKRDYHQQVDVHVRAQPIIIVYQAYML